MELVKHVWEIIRKHSLFVPGQVIIIGLSGGPDSVTLAYVLHQINKRFKQDWNLAIVHLNHKLRGKKSDADEKFAKTMASELGIHFYSARKNILAISKKNKQSMEESARLERYNFFNSIARKLKRRGKDLSIAVGHNLDDNAETVLFRIIRGSGLKGLRGILPKRRLYDKSPFWLVRPLVYVRRTEIIDYLKKEKIPFRTDATNKSKKMMRNRIRHKLLPALREYNSSVAEHLVQLSASASEHYDFLDDEVKAKMPPRVRFLNVKSLRREHPVVQMELINKLMERNKYSVKKITFTHYYAIRKMIYSRDEFSETHLPNKVTAKIKRGKLTVFKND